MDKKQRLVDLIKLVHKTKKVFSDQAIQITGPALWNTLDAGKKLQNCLAF